MQQCGATPAKRYAHRSQITEGEESLEGHAVCAAGCKHQRGRGFLVCRLSGTSCKLAGVDRAGLEAKDAFLAGEEVLPGPAVLPTGLRGGDNYHNTDFTDIHPFLFRLAQ